MGRRSWRGRAGGRASGQRGSAIRFGVPGLAALHFCRCPQLLASFGPSPAVFPRRPGCNRCLGWSPYDIEVLRGCTLILGAQSSGLWPLEGCLDATECRCTHLLFCLDLALLPFVRPLGLSWRRCSAGTPVLRGLQIMCVLGRISFLRPEEGFPGGGHVSAKLSQSVMT